VHKLGEEHPQFSFTVVVVFEGMSIVVNGRKKGRG